MRSRINLTKGEDAMDDLKKAEAESLKQIYKDILIRIEDMKKLSILPVEDALDRLFEARDEIQGILAPMEAAGLLQ